VIANNNAPDQNNRHGVLPGMGGFLHRLFAIGPGDQMLVGKPLNRNALNGNALNGNRGGAPDQNMPNYIVPVQNEPAQHEHPAGLPAQHEPNHGMSDDTSQTKPGRSASGSTRTSRIKTSQIKARRTAARPFPVSVR
jgi:hypothetical protein